ncbi:MAG: cytochrome c3 family protein [Desulfuromonadaceae bacterium]|nr:cytochrome c3 family protein [Desulfuromonadaceae bacterium]
MKLIVAEMACLYLLVVGVAFATVGGGDVAIKSKKGEVVFSHDNHVGMGLECTKCHDGLFTTSAQHKKVTMKQMQQGKSCGACHNGKTAFSVKGDCKNCHK